MATKFSSRRFIFPFSSSLDSMDSSVVRSMLYCSAARWLISVMLVFCSFLISASRSRLFWRSSGGKVQARSIMNRVIMAFSSSFLVKVTSWLPGSFLPVASAYSFTSKYSRMIAGISSCVLTTSRRTRPSWSTLVSEIMS